MKEEIKIGTTVYYDKYKSIGRGEVIEIKETAYGISYKVTGRSGILESDEIYLEIEQVKEKMRKEAEENYKQELSDINEMKFS